MAKFRPGISIHVNLWIFIIVIIASGLAARYLVKVDPDYQKSEDLVRHLEKRLAVNEVRAVVKGGMQQTVAEKILKISLYLPPEEYDDETAREKIQDNCFDLVKRYSPLLAGQIVITAKKKKAGSGCQPQVEVSPKEYLDPRVDIPEKRKSRKPQNLDKNTADDPVDEEN